MVLSPVDRKAKLEALAESEGCGHIEELLQRAVLDGVCPAICVLAGCNYTTEMEPDQDRGYCEVCGNQTVQSALVLAGLI